MTTAIGSNALTKSIAQWIDEELMALFFFVVVLVCLAGTDRKLTGTREISISERLKPHAGIHNAGSRLRFSAEANSIQFVFPHGEL